jgi:transposase
MLTDDQREYIRRAYHLDGKSLRQIARDLGISRDTVTKVVTPTPFAAARTKPARLWPVLGPYQARINDLLDQNSRLPPKQRLTAHRIFTLLQDEGFPGCESRVRQYISERKQALHPPDRFIPLAFEPGQDAQVDWGEAQVLLGGNRQTIQLFIMRLCYSRHVFAMAFPSEKQECFFYAHVRAFEYFGGVPARLTYDNLATAVKLALDRGEVSRSGRRRHEQHHFVALRSHYLFESHFCTPHQPHEKGGVEEGVGYVRRNYLTPLPDVASFDELNAELLRSCRRDDQRRVAHQSATIGAMWEAERPLLRPLPPFAFDCCTLVQARVTPYSQVVFETNRYSVPVHRAVRDVTVKAYPFHVEILDKTTLVARHERCYGRDQDVFDPLHYLPLLEQRPGAFDYARPLRRWREEWPMAYHRMLRELRAKWPEGRGVQEFIRILYLHQDYPASVIEQAVQQALAIGCVHLDGVLHCLHQLTPPLSSALPSDMEQVLADRHLQDVGEQPIDLKRYERLLKQSW